MFYAALDVSLSSVAICIIDEAGKVRLARSVPSDVPDIVRCFNDFGESIHQVGLEAGTLTQHLTYGLTESSQMLTVFTEITLKNHRQIDFARFLATVEKVDQVMECHLVSGGYDYLVKFVTAGISEYQTIMERLYDMEIGIDKYFSFVVLKSPIVKARMPLTSLFPL